MVFAFEKFCSYFICTKVIAHIDNEGIKYLMAMKATKPRFISWVQLVQEFDFRVKDQKRNKNQVAKHLSHLKEKAMNKLRDINIDDTLLCEQILVALQDLTPWIANFSNYLASYFI